MARILAVIPLLLTLTYTSLCQEQKPKETTDPQKMETSVWRVPIQFFSSADPSNKNGLRKPLPGFHSKQNPNSIQYDASEFLKSQGVAFPPGSDAIYDESGGCLIVRNTREQLELISSLWSDGGVTNGPRNVLIDLSTFECDLPVNDNSDAAHRPTYSDLLRLPKKNIKLLDRVNVVTKSGQRSTVNHLKNPASNKPPGTEFEKDFNPKPSESNSFHKGESGTLAEVEPQVGPDDTTIDVNLSYRFRTQSEGNGASEVSFATSVTSWDDYPVVLHVSPVQNHAGKYIVVVMTPQLINSGGWKLKEAREDLKKTGTEAH
ncbi:MAG: hypothetical protein WCH43_01220 [Verrucomicrobiota bacterium]